MLGTNLATRPFYNERLVHGVLVVIAATAVLLTVLNVAWIVALSSGQGDVAGRAASAEARADTLRQSADSMRKSVNAAELDRVQQAAREANEIIDSRSFSWTDLFNQFEKTLPDDVRIVMVTPRVERDGRMVIAMVVVGRQAEDIDGFIGKLEATGTFADLLSRQESVNQDGLLETVLEGRYLRTPGRSAAQVRP
jgi:hypothetical protein